MQETLEAFIYAGDDPVTGTDPSGMAGSGLLGQCAFATTCPNVREYDGHHKRGGSLFSVLEDVSADVVHFFALHKVLIRVALGALSVATGGVDFLADVAFEGTFLTTTVADATVGLSGSGPFALDQHRCASGDEVACVGRDFGSGGALASWASVYGHVTDVAPDTIKFGVRKGISAAGLTLGTAAILTDAISRHADRR